MDHVKLSDIDTKFNFSSPERVLFYGPNIDPRYLHSKLKGLQNHFSSECLGLCTHTPFLLPLALVLNQHTQDLDEILGRYNIEMPDGYTTPLEVSIDGAINRTYAVKKIIGATNSGIIYAHQKDLRGVFVTPGIEINRVLNSGRLSHDPLIPYIDAFAETRFLLSEIHEAIKEGSDSVDTKTRKERMARFSREFRSLICDNLPQGQWLHILLPELLAQVGVVIPSEDMTFTLNQQNAVMYLKDI